VLVPTGADEAAASSAVSSGAAAIVEGIV
jgi:hypothetical protein